MDLARKTALALLETILETRVPLDEALPGAIEPLEPRDRAFLRQLVATTLRRLGQIDDLIDRCLERPLPDQAARVRMILRLGAAQLLFMETPPHAAINTSVNLASSDAHPRIKSLKGLINAILRRLTREGEAMLADQDSARLNTPSWLWDRWLSAYGEESARAIANAHLSAPPLDLTLKPGEDVAAWAGRLEAVSLPTGSLRRESGGRIEELPGFADGAWWIQDAAAALPAKLFGDVSGTTMVDLCAAPGGKAAQLAAAGARVFAVDRSAHRLERLRENFSRLKLEAEVIRANGSTWKPGTPVDGVLVDAPCLATGTIRRHPDIAWLKGVDDLKGITPVQDALLANAAAMLRPGGLLVYCVCSLEPEEGEARIERLLGTDKSLARAPIEAREIGGLGEAITPAGDVRTLPSQLGEQGGLDGFFIARLQKSQ